ncbi:HelD family protein [Streptomyces griseoaurantiacus]|uniref:HelD family protein n=1 Tax=Streptomyces griseoaurantiacus TaxID=68213 RepID=UPI003788C036
MPSAVPPPVPAAPSVASVSSVSSASSVSSVSSVSLTPPAPAPPAPLRAERAHHEACRAALAALLAGADEQVVTGEDVSASGADAEVLGRQLRGRARDLRELPEGPLFFGRLDFAEDAPGHAGQSYHIGRLRLSTDPAAPPLVVDWRAPVSRAFYQASVAEPQGVAVRRRFGWAPGSRGASADLTGFEDEPLTGATAPEGPGRLLTAEIERPRLGPMRDIAATIQPEQDDLVRAGLSTTLCVQGAPGTGKTAVGLHRAAYLLYTHPRRIRRGGLLVLGPHRTFLSYISEVLPALGETGVRQSTLADEIARHPVTAEDASRAAEVKHDPRMAEVLRRALYAGVDPDGAADLTVPDGAHRLRVSGGTLRQIVAAVRAEEPPYAVGRERVRTRIAHHVRERAERRTGPLGAAWLRRVAHCRPVGAYLDTVWPRARPEEVLAALLGDRTVLAAAAEGLLDESEQRALAWARAPRSPRSARWSAADLVLLDELAGLIEHPEGYAHVVVDEAQDLSPMECRAIARRAAFGSLTVLGDLAQGTTPWSARDWPALLAHLGRPEAAVIPLTTGFRVPEAVLGLANWLLDRLDVDVPRARSLRRDGELTVRHVRHPEELDGAVVEAVRRALTHEGSVGVITVDRDAERVRGVLGAAGIGAAGPEQPAAPVVVVPAGAVKGLEYDHVVAVEPAAIAEAEPRGPHRLYVVLTRAVSRLDVLHSRPLPW